MAIPSKVETSIFCIPLPGKPDPKIQWDPASKEERPRIAQKEQKGNSCAYYALQMIRDKTRIGKYPLDSQMEARKIEKMISAHRKEISKIDETFLPPITYANALIEQIKSCEDFTGGITRARAKQYLKNINRSQLQPCLRDKYTSYLEPFCTQEIHNDLLTYTNDCYNQAKSISSNLFFKAFDIFDQEIQDFLPKRLGKSWQELTSSEKEVYRSNMVFMTSHKLYGCKPSLWHPEQPFKTLIEQLKNHGPHALAGRFGKAYYKEKPVKLDPTIEGRPLFMWDTLPFTRKEFPNNHLIVIVGAATVKEKEYVYFLDPLDSSDPKDITTQKIYAISFDTLKLSIVNLSGTRPQILDGKMVFDKMEKGENNYALHM